MLNSVSIIGRLANDPAEDLAYTNTGRAVLSFRVAQDRPQSSEARQQGQDKVTDFIPCVAWQQTAEFMAERARKGLLCSVQGRLQVENFVTQDGQKRSKMEVVVDKFNLLEWPKDDEEGAGASGNGGGNQQRAPQGNQGGGGNRSAGGGGNQQRGFTARGNNAGGGRSQGGRNQVPAGVGAGNDDDLSDVEDPFAG